MARSGTFKYAAVTDVKVSSLSAEHLLNEPHVQLARIRASHLPTHLHHLTHSQGNNVRMQDVHFQDKRCSSSSAVWRTSQEKLAGIIQSEAEGSEAPVAAV